MKKEINMDSTKPTEYTLLIEDKPIHEQIEITLKAIDILTTICAQSIHTFDPINSNPEFQMCEPLFSESDRELIKKAIFKQIDRITYLQGKQDEETININKDASKNC